MKAYSLLLILLAVSMTGLAKATTRQAANCSSVWLMSPTSAPSMSQRGVVQTRWHRPSGE